jgi:enterochelin esterase-like enzyme
LIQLEAAVPHHGSHRAIRRSSGLIALFAMVACAGRPPAPAPVWHDEFDRGIGGSSAGGLAALFAVIRGPSEFGRLLIESPSLHAADARVLEEAATLGTWSARIYLGAGTNEMGAATCDPQRRFVTFRTNERCS